MNIYLPLPHSFQLCVLSGWGKQEGSELHLSVRESGFAGHPVNECKPKCAAGNMCLLAGICEGRTHPWDAA